MYEDCRLDLRLLVVQLDTETVAALFVFLCLFGVEAALESAEIEFLVRSNNVELLRDVVVKGSSSAGGEEGRPDADGLSSGNFTFSP